ncbi:hypothetical protein ACTG4Q_20850 [Bradyrhizobium denitrificans]
MSRAFEEFQARVRASARMHCEADLYWRANRWEFQPTMKAGEFIVIAAGMNVGRSTFGTRPPGAGKAVAPEGKG